YQTEKLLADSADKVPADVKAEVDGALAELRESLKGEDTSAVRAATQKAAAAAQKIGTALYAQPGGAPGTGGSADGAAGPDEDVVDAEIVDDERSARQSTGS
ncbi:molecular chaperone DnaK, partial [Streptomyces sp. SMC 277]|nr:molecular chaperone DnaK [Streptomyces antimicrobicus]